MASPAVQALMHHDMQLSGDVEPFVAQLMEKHGMDLPTAVVSLFGFMAGELLVRYRVPRKDLDDMLDRAVSLYGKVLDPSVQA